MCGIVGYTGSEQATPILLRGLGRLEYRGYDSAGVAIFNGSRLEVQKAKGKLGELVKRLEECPISGHMGIGHTRWATHGVPSDENSHPHTDEKGTIAVVHNGIIENYLELKEALVAKGLHLFFPDGYRGGSAPDQHVRTGEYAQNPVQHHPDAARILRAGHSKR